MDDGQGGDFAIVLNTIGYTSQFNFFLATNLTSSLQYRFKLEAYNYNLLAPGDASDISYIYACDVPNLNESPNKVATSLDSIRIHWN